MPKQPNIGHLTNRAYKVEGKIAVVTVHHFYGPEPESIKLIEPQDLAEHLKVGYQVIIKHEDYENLIKRRNEYRTQLNTYKTKGPTSGITPQVVKDGDREVYEVNISVRKGEGWWQIKYKDLEIDNNYTIIFEEETTNSVWTGIDYEGIKRRTKYEDVVNAISTIKKLVKELKAE